MTAFNLIPFSSFESLPKIEVSGSISRNYSQLDLTFELKGDLAEIAIAAPDSNPCRQDNLWQTTCFEFFLGEANQDSYWEFNLSPASHWNCYRFEGYRRGMVVERNLTNLPFSLTQSEEQLSLALSLDLSSLIASTQAIEISITTVIQTVNQDLSYWAITHTGKEPDFHRRDSFIIVF